MPTTPPLPRTPGRTLVAMSEFFPTETFSKRLSTVRDIAAQAGLDGVIVTPGPDMEYLISSKITTHERFTALVLTKDATRIIVPGVDVADLKKSVAGQLGVEIIGWNDGEDPYGYIAEGSYAVSAAMTADHLLELAVPRYLHRQRHPGFRPGVHPQGRRRACRAAPRKCRHRRGPPPGPEPAARGRDRERRGQGTGAPHPRRA